MKKVKQIAAVLIMCLYFPVVLSFVAVEKNNMVCDVVLPAILDSSEIKFISPEDIRHLVLDQYTGVLGRLMVEMDCEKMESFFEKHPAIKNCEVYYTLGGALHVDVLQRQPLVRIYGSSGTYYLDIEGEKMPVFDNHTAHVLVANGYFGKLESMDELVDLATMLHENEFWKAQIEQVYIDEHGDFILVPRVGDHVIEFGGIEDAQVKLENLYALYTYGWDVREWNMYKKVNLKYKGQIVCTKG